MSGVLVVDDAGGRRTAVGVALADRDYEVTTASDRRSAVERVREDDPGVVVLAVDPRAGTDERGATAPSGDPGPDRSTDPVETVQRVVAAGPTPVVAVADPSVAGELDAFEDTGGVAVVAAGEHPTDEAVEAVVGAVGAVEGTPVPELATAVTAATARSVQRTVAARRSTGGSVDRPDAGATDRAGPGGVDREPARAGVATPGPPAGGSDTRAGRDDAPVGDRGELSAGADGPAREAAPGQGSTPSFVPPDGEFAPTVVVGASTGGPNVVETVLAGLPRSLAARVLVVQHMPESFTGRLADHLDAVCEYDVREATDGTVGAGEAVVARGGRHLRVTGRDGDRIRVALTDEAPVHGVRPAVDVTMESAAEHATRPLVAVVLTGMGRDGAAGVEAVGAAGGLTIAQDRDTSAVFGMPEQAIATGAVDAVLPAAAVPAAICERLQEDQ